MAATYRFAPRIGKMRCCNCRSEFVVRPGAHPEAACPMCESLYYEWLDYESFKLESEPRGARRPLEAVRTERELRCGSGPSLSGKKSGA